jgi:hypothetical protein
MAWTILLYYLSAVIIVARHHIKSMLYVVNYVYPSYQGYHQNMDDQGVELEDSRRQWPMVPGSRHRYM